MKKLTALVLVMLMLATMMLTLTACDDSSQLPAPTPAIPPPTPTPTPTSTPTPTPAPTPTPSPDPLVINYVDMFYNFNHRGALIQITGRMSTRDGTTNVFFEEGIAGTIAIYDSSYTNSEKFQDGDFITVTGRVNRGPDEYNRINFVHIGQTEARLATYEEIAQMEAFLEIREENARLAEEERLQEEEERLQREEALRQWARQSEERILQEERDFRNSARTIAYDNLVRYPDRYQGEIIRITVRITQIFDRGGVLGFLYDRGFAGVQGNNLWVIGYTLPEGAARILVGDTVTFYGVYDGIRERRRSIDGVSVFVPHMTATLHS